MCDIDEQIACYKKKWIDGGEEYKTIKAEIGELNNEAANINQEAGEISFDAPPYPAEITVTPAYVKTMSCANVQSGWFTATGTSNAEELATSGETIEGNVPCEFYKDTADKVCSFSKIKKQDGKKKFKFLCE